MNSVVDKQKHTGSFLDTYTQTHTHINTTSLSGSCAGAEGSAAVRGKVDGTAVQRSRVCLSNTVRKPRPRT